MAKKYTGPYRECPFVDGGVIPSNILDEYSTVTYNLKLYMLGLKSLIDGSGDEGLGYIVDDDNELIIAQTGVTDIKIDGLTIDAVIGGGTDSATSGAIGTTVEFTITQPLRFDLIERLLAAQEALGLVPFQQYPLFLEIGFVGGQKNTTDYNGEQVSYSAPTKIIKLLFVEYDIKIQSNSTEYLFQCVGYEEGQSTSNSTRKTLKQDSTIFYRNLKEGLDDIANQFTRSEKLTWTLAHNDTLPPPAAADRRQRAAENQFAESGPVTDGSDDETVNPNEVTDNYGTIADMEASGTTYDIHEIDTTQFYPDLGAELDSETSWKYILQGYNPYTWQMEKPFPVDQYTNLVDLPDSRSSGDANTKEDQTVPITYTGTGEILGSKYITRKFDKASNLTIYDMIESVVSEHPDVINGATRIVKSLQELKNLKEEDIDYDKTNVLWFDVQTEVTPRGYDFINNRVTHKYFHKVFLKSMYNTMFLSVGEINKMSPDGRRNLQRTLNAITHRYYPYIFTGQNDQIINCNIVDKSGNSMMLIPELRGANFNIKKKTALAKRETTELKEEIEQKLLAGVLDALDISKYITKIKEDVEDVIIDGAQATVQDVQRIITLARSKGFTALLGGDIDFVNTRIDPDELGRISPLGQSVTKLQERVDKAKTLIDDIKNIENVISEEFGQAGEDLYADIIAKATGIEELVKKEIQRLTEPLRSGLLAPVEEALEGFKSDLTALAETPLFENLGLDDEVDQFLEEVFDPINEVLDNIQNINDIITGFDLITDFMPDFNDPRLVELNVEDIPVKYLDEILERPGFQAFKDYNEAPQTQTTEGVPKEGAGKLNNTNKIDTSVVPNVLEVLYNQNKNPAFLKEIELEIKGDPYWLPGTVKTGEAKQSVRSIKPISEALTDKSTMVPNYFERLFVFSFNVPDYDSSLGKKSVQAHGRYTGYYLATTVTHNFSDGQYTCVLTGVKTERIPLPEQLSNTAEVEVDAGGTPDVGTPQEPIPRIPTNPLVYLEGEGVYMDANGEKFTTEEIQEYLDWKRNNENSNNESGETTGPPNGD